MGRNESNHLTLPALGEVQNGRHEIVNYDYCDYQALDRLHLWKFVSFVGLWGEFVKVAVALVVVVL